MEVSLQWSQRSDHCAGKMVADVRRILACHLVVDQGQNPYHRHWTSISALIS